MFYVIIRYWEKTSSLENLKNWLPNDDSVISVDLTSRYDGDGAITVLCGNLQCTFGVKTYRHVGYPELERN